jgi:ubiquinone/menaquinone biosynthesis C-methylase UbiE
MLTESTDPGARKLVKDETALLASLVALEGAHVLELGCGAGEFTRRLAETKPIASITGFEVDAIQHAKNVAAPSVPKVTFAAGGAEDIPAGDASVDGVAMIKSLHHVPVEALDAALAEVARVLKPGGWLYVSEPVFAGPYNDVIRLFHDEGRVRREAYAALGRAEQRGVLEQEKEIHFDSEVVYRDFEDFQQRMIAVTHTEHRLTPGLLAQVRQRFETHMTPDGARFMRPMRVNLMRRPPAPRPKEKP